MYDLALQHDFDRAHRTVRLRDLLALVTRRSNRLLSYHEVGRGDALGAVNYRGVRSVPIDRIVGSVERVDDFDRAFRPRKRHSSRRWQRVARAYFDGIGLPAVQLYEVGGNYYVQDGHHRISVARLYGQQFLDAEVTAASTTEASAATAGRATPAVRLPNGLRSLDGAPARSWRPRPRPVAPVAVGALDCPRCAAA